MDERKATTLSELGALLMGAELSGIDWEQVPEERHAGLSGEAVWRVLNVGRLRVRRVSYSAGYLADHWCHRGHVVHVLDGELVSHVQGGPTTRLAAGQSYVVGEGNAPHQSETAAGAELLIVD